MITLISTPEYDVDRAEPCRWLATESPNNFRLLRQDYFCSGANNGGKLRVTTTENFMGADDDDIAVYCANTNQMYVGTVTNIDVTLRIIDTDIDWVATMNITYMNDNTLFGGYYFEGRLTVNDVLYPLTIRSSPDSFGYADLDVSGILRIVTSLGKTGDYTQRLMAETNKSGKFNFEYRECWYGSDELWEGVAVTSPAASPPILIDWYYAEAVRSEEQGSNLHDFVADDLNDAPFFNQFEEPVYFAGLPFDISYILPERALVSPTADITVILNIYDSNNLLLRTITENIPADSLEGYIGSLTISELDLPEGYHHMTAEITCL